MVKTGRVFAYDFSQNRIPGVTDAGEHAYWRDVGTIEAYYEANLDLKNVVPHFNLYNWEWPILSANYPDPPSKLVFDDAAPAGRGPAVDHLRRLHHRRRLRQGLRARPQRVRRRGGRGARLDPVRQRLRRASGARIQRAIIDKNVRVADGDHIGHDLARDAIRHHVSDGGITVVAKARDTLLTRSRDF